ncbi:MAG: hypothetical protein P0Y60_14390 [Candidatus Microbacterium colombiense]|nr:MAG: hypothetical protein P0Y60_14390 [Microbacterium sp.]
MRLWNRFTFWTYVAFGSLAAFAALGGVGMLFFAPGTGVVLLVVSAVLGMLSLSVKRSYDAVTRPED